MADTNQETNERPSTNASEDGLPNPPGPNGIPLIGNTIGFLRDGLDFVERLAEHGDVVRYTALGETFVVVCDPHLVESVLVSRNDEFWKGSFETEFGRLLAPNGLVFTDGEQWRSHRSQLQSVFTPARLRSHTESIRTAAASAADEWCTEETIDLRASCSKLTLSILADTLFTIDLTTARGTIVREAVTAITERTDISQLANIWPEWAPRTPTERRFDRAMADLDGLIEELIHERRRSDTEHEDLLRVLLSVEGMDEETVRDQLVTFLFAGHETTALALTYSLWLLSGHPAITEQVRSERTESTTDHVIKEALRLYPPIYLLYREPRHDVALGGYRIPRGTTLQLPTYTLHRDRRWWNEPNAFVPDRWTGTTTRPEYAYFPFGGGPRHCIGMRFALTELNIVLTELLQRIAFERVTGSLTLSPSALLEPGTVPMRVHERT